MALGAPRPPVRVLVVDDSALVRRLLTDLLGADPELVVVGAARDPFEARHMVKALSPDVLTLDIEMPKMDGLTFLRNLMRLRPMPVVMISSLTASGAEATLTALEIGAFDFVAKPKLGIANGIEAAGAEIAAKVKAAARAWTPDRERQRPLGGAKLTTSTGPLRTTDLVVALGASTGGTEAIADLLAGLPPDAPGVVVAQHIPESFSAAFAARLDRDTALTVAEAQDGDVVALGRVLIAPGNRHLRVERSGARYICRLGADEPVNRHRPSVDVLFESVAQNVGPNAIGVLLTGMGTDGAAGLRTMLTAGAHTIAQDRESSVVWGMPGEAVRRGAAREVLALTGIAARLVELARSTARG